VLRRRIKHNPPKGIFRMAPISYSAGLAGPSLSINSPVSENVENDNINSGSGQAAIQGSGKFQFRTIYNSITSSIAKFGKTVGEKYENSEKLLRRILNEEKDEDLLERARTKPDSIKNWPVVMEKHHLKLSKKYTSEGVDQIFTDANIVYKDVHSGNSEECFKALEEAEANYKKADFRSNEMCVDLIYIITNKLGSDYDFNDVLKILKNVFDENNIHYPTFDANGQKQLNECDFEKLKVRAQELAQSSDINNASVKKLDEKNPQFSKLLSADDIFDKLVNKELLESGLKHNNDVRQIGHAYRTANEFFSQSDLNPPLKKHGMYSNWFYITEDNKNIDQLSDSDIIKLNENYNEILINPLRYKVLS
jgi:hypothetical protein